jgi:ribosomal protein S18 acetylase RimI-like enzyme
MPPATAQAITTTSPTDLERAVSVIVLAFGADPAARWTYPEPQQYLIHFPAAVRAFGGKAITHGTCRHVTEFRGAALWLPPGVLPDDEALGAVFHASVPEPRRSELFGVFERMGSYHPPEPHWYLPLIGVDPDCQRRGYGAALLGPTLAQCDHEGVAAYLESSNPANLSLYQRHGFEVLATIQVGSSPPIFPMLRRPQ